MKWRWLSLGALAAAMVVMAAAGTAGAYATGTYGSGAYGSCDYGVNCSISLSSSGTVSLDVLPGPGSKCTIQADTASVLTDDTNGYTLTLSDNGTNTSLINGAYNIPAIGSSFASPAALSANTWGYRVDGLGGFGSGPTSSQSNASPGSVVFAPIQPSNLTADTLASTSSAADPAVVTTIWYGECADTTSPSGTYTTQVTYTALAN